MKFIAVIGMPRSGTTIVSAYLNSQLGALVVGEPHGIEKTAQHRSRLTTLPYRLSLTQYGELALYYFKPVLDQIEEFAEIEGVSILGFKEAWTPDINPIKIIEENADRIDRTIITLREPRRNYSSILKHYSLVSGISAATFENHWKALYRYGVTNDKARFVILDQFRASPASSLQRASGLDIREEDLLSLPGNGDAVARASTEIRKIDRQEKSVRMFPEIERLYRLATVVAENYENKWEVQWLRQCLELQENL